MTLINIELAGARSRHTMLWRPYRRPAGDVTQSFQLTLINGVGRVDLEPNSYWFVIEGQNGREVIITVPLEGPVTYAELAPLDPATIPPNAGPSLAWEEQLKALQDYVFANLGSDGPGAGSGAIIRHQSSPASTWIITHDLNRLVNVAVWVDGELVEADVTATTTVVTVSFPSPQSGFVVIN